jgi:hypothetical protein
MFRFTKKPSSGSHSQYLTKITSLVQCRYKRRTEVFSAMAAYYAAIALWLPDDGFFVNRNMLEKHP